MINDDLHRDLLITALEGGSNYWYYIPDVIKTRKQSFSEAVWETIASGLPVDVYDVEGDEEERDFLGTITLDSIEDADKILNDEFEDVYNRIVEEQFDAEDADIWFQLIVMKEVVFG